MTIEEIKLNLDTEDSKIKLLEKKTEEERQKEKEEKQKENIEKEKQNNILIDFIKEKNLLKKSPENIVEELYNK
jgi:uncharacterized Fe-S cluster-containing protein